jgi:chemotaxis protein CheD
MKVSNRPGDTIVTHSLGSCIAVVIHDPDAEVAGLLHFQLPDSKSNPDRASDNPYMYADTGIPLLFKSAYKLGAEKKRMIVKVVGGSNVLDRNGFFSIGERNYVATRKILWKNGVFIDAEDVGGESWRTVRVEVATGRMLVKNSERTFEL